MSKGLKYGMIAFFSFLVIAIVIIPLSIDSIVKHGIENVGSRMTGTEVTVNSVSISPFSGSGTVDGLKVGNPEGYEQENAVEINETFVQMEVLSLLSDLIVVEEVTVTGPAVKVIQNLDGNNLSTIRSNVNEAAERKDAAEKDMLIRYFVMRNGSAELFTEVGGDRSSRVDLPTIELENVGSDNGAQSVEAVIQSIADRVVGEVLEVAVRGGLESLLDDIRGIFRQD